MEARLQDIEDKRAVMEARMRAALGDIEDKLRFLAHLEEEPKACHFGRWSLTWEGEGRVVAVVGNGTHTVRVNTRAFPGSHWPRQLAAALAELEPDRWHEGE